MTAFLQVTRDQMITMALRQTGALAKGEVADADDLADCALPLNMLLKYWHTEMGYQPMYMSQVSFASVAGTQSYTLGPSGTVVVATGRPIRIPEGWTQDSNGDKLPITFLSEQEFNLLTPRNSPGIPINAYYKPNDPNGTLEIWQVPTDTSRTFYLTVQGQLQDLTNGASVIGVRNETLLAVMWGLAEQVMGMYGTPETTQRRIEKNAPIFLNAAMAFLEEESSVKFQPNFQGGGGYGRR
jgi:hypothetical protein